MRGVTDLSETMVKTIADLEQIKQAYLDETAKSRYQILVCSGAGCVSSNCAEVRDAVRNELIRIGMSDQVIVRETGCIGTCAVGPVMLVLPERTFYCGRPVQAGSPYCEDHHRACYDGKGKVHVPFHGYPKK